MVGAKKCYYDLCQKCKTVCPQGEVSNDAENMFGILASETRTKGHYYCVFCTPLPSFCTERSCGTDVWAVLVCSLSPDGYSDLAPCGSFRSGWLQLRSPFLSETFQLTLSPYYCSRCSLFTRQTCQMSRIHVRREMTPRWQVVSVYYVMRLGAIVIYLHRNPVQPHSYRIFGWF